MTLYDDFSSGSYSLVDGQTSPNGKWLDHYNGYGSSGSSGGTYNMGPQVSTTAGTTHACLTVSTQKFVNPVISVDMRTNKQLRTGSPPNPWETAWLMYYVDDFHHYYVTLKTTGLEVGKKDNANQAEAQVFLATPSSPKVTIGAFQNVQMQVNSTQITVWVNGVLAANVTDTTQSATLAQAGAIGLYCEDASVSFDNVNVAAASTSGGGTGGTFFHHKRRQ